MSDFRAIGGVSVTLQTLLYDRMERPDGVGDVAVTLGPPRFTPRDNEPLREDPRVNLFLYRVSENGYLKNQEIPGREVSGAYGHPPLSVNLHFLVTAYGNSDVPTVAGQTGLLDDRRAHFLLGSAMRVLHDFPVVTEALVTVRPPSGRAVLHESLRGEFEQVKVTLDPLSLEDVTKIWTALTLRYRLSAAYAVTVVQMESQRRRRIPRLVGEPPSRIPPLPGDRPVPGPNVEAFTIRTPSIAEVHVRRAGETRERVFPYARVGDTLVLRGTNLAGGVTVVRMGELDLPVAGGTDDRLEVRVPDATIPGVGAIPPEQHLQPGAIALSVSVASALAPRRAMRSNDAVFVLVPTVTPASLVYGPGPPRTLTIDGARLVSSAPGGETVIGRSVIPRAAYTTATPARIVMNLPDALPAQPVTVLLSGPLPDPVPMGPAAQRLDITIGGVTASVTADLPVSVPRAALPALLQAVIRDADPRFAGTRVGLHVDRLAVIPGGFASPVSVGSPPPATAADDLRLTAAQPSGAANALLSGELDPFPTLTSARALMRIRIGGLGPFPLAFDRPTSLADLAGKLETAMHGASGAAAFTAALVTIVGHHVLVIPGAAADVAFEGVPGDESVAELLLHARHAVRVRVNGAESVDEAVLELPR